MTDQSNDGAWFAEKRFGYGAGLPLTWQGWTIMFGYLVAILLLVWLINSGNVGIKGYAIVAMLLTTMAFIETTRRHTRGGWKWRWGEEE